ncbi:hypothetical protein GOBAR_DD33037 [Gossypium barbadense]|nr:hypothetical protein GOBAR_DD33037 [Gossypium barbadense]
MELQQHIGHPHPLVFNQEINHQSEETFCCFGCNRKHFLFFEDNINSHCVLVVVIEISFTNAKIVNMLWM